MTEETLKTLNARRSIGRMRPEAPPRQLIEELLAAAVEAPNHHDTQPWRFFVIAGEARSELGDVLAQALRERERALDEAKLEMLAAAESAKPLRSPVLIVVGVQNAGRDEMTRREDLQAASAAIQNMRLAAHSLGLSAIWRTGDGAYDSRVKAYFGLGPADEIAGIVYVGYADASVSAVPRRREFADKTEWRGALA